jgi:3-dehydroquinate synthetase
LIRSEFNARFDSMQRTMIQFGGGMIATFVGLIVAVVLRGG